VLQAVDDSCSGLPASRDLSLGSGQPKLFAVASSGSATPPAAERSSTAGVPRSELDVYHPGSEDLEPDEIRVVALGIGQPSSRPKQASACWLVELGNGDEFLLDIGSGSSERISALKITDDFLDKVFIGHLHHEIESAVQASVRVTRVGKPQRP
jgi:ribonuclease Z